MLELNKVYLGDCLDVLKLIDDNSIDLIFTDPPYPKEFSHCYDYLADECPRIMKKGSSLMTIVGHYALEEIMEKFHGKLKYRWTCCMSQLNGKHARMAMGIEVCWKPILWYVKEAYPCGRGFLKDCVEIKGKAGQLKEKHKWEQDIDWATYYISKLTKEGDVVLDPFIGSGTVAEACLNLNRKFIGIEKNKEYYDLCIDRINKHIPIIDNTTNKIQEKEQIAENIIIQDQEVQGDENSFFG